METSKKSTEQHSFEIQEIQIKNSPNKTNSLMEKDREENKTKYVPYHDLFLNSSSTDSIQEKIFDGKTEVILLEPEAVRNRHKTDHTVANCRVIELSHSDSKMTLRQQFGETIDYSNSNLQNNTADYENMNILRKLPPDTVVIRQETRRSKENSDYKELTETNGSGSNSISGCATAKAKRIPRVVRNKTRETIEVRRNPMRVSKKNIDKDFSRPKQRLLANKKRDIYSSYESGKCTRSSATPYMNTRSVTRKMYTVGATYQAPTKRDETEWKEWPVHGMHERPVYHPQAGLAVEYLGRYFTSLDGLSYCEIIDEPEIEVVAVDPHRDRRFPSIEKKPKGKTKIKSKRPLNDKDAWGTYLSMKNKSFETCMHGSLHCVLGYCSQIMTPAYKQAVEEKTTKLTVSATSTSSLAKESAKETRNFKDNAMCSSESVSKFTGEAKLLEAYAIAMAQSAQNKSTVNNTSKAVSTFASSSAMYVPEAQRLIVENNGAKSVCSSYESGKYMSREMIQMDLKRILRGPPNNSLILLRSSAAKGNNENCTATAKDVINSVKLENTPINDETLMEMSSIYKKLVFTDEPTLNREEPRHNLYNLKRHVTNAREYTTKVFVNNQLENKKIVQVTKENNENRNIGDMKANRESDGCVPTTSSGKTRAWCTTETSEIAKILSEYNRGTSKKSAIQNQIYCSRANLMNSNIKNLPKNLWQTDRTEGNQSFVTNVSTALDFSQGKWKFHTIPEKTKDQIANNTQIAWNSSSMSENHQVSLKDRQMNLNALNYIREKSIESRKDITEQREIVMVDTKSKEIKSGCSKDKMESSKTESLEELLENTAILYCAANGVHQDDLSSYIDTLDSKQSIQWLENWNNTIV